MASDIAAVQAGAGRTLSCSIRGSGAPYPKGFTSGVLTLTRERADWKPYWFTPWRKPIAIESVVLSTKTRNRNVRTDWNIKSAGMYKSDGLLPASGFTVLVCTTPTGWIELAVPTIDVPVAKAYFARGAQSG